MSEYKENDNIWYILHISDFHLTEDPEKNKYAKKALDSLAKALKDSRIKVKYLIHTGDMINSSDIYVEAANRISECKTYIIGTDEKKFDAGNFKKGVSINIIERFNKELEDIANKRFEIASCMMSDFISQINVLHSNVVICCGNHDVVRPIKAKNCEPECTLVSAQNNEKSGVASYSCGNDVVDTFKPFEEFLKKMNVANSIAQQKTTNAQCFELDDLNLLVLNTNWPNPEKAKDGYFCVRCDQAIKNIKKCSNKLNVIVAHKPIYEICEAARLPYKRYIKTSFMAKIQEFIDDHGIYLCGDKHTRSIVASAFHDIPHYIGGEPLTKNKKGNNSFEVEYNLISVDGNNVGRARKIHLVSRDGNKWKCEFRLPDGLISKLYDISRPYINRYSLEMLKGTLSLHTWENICQTIYGWEKKERSKRFGAINSLYLATCKYRLEGIDDYNWTSNENIFVYLFRRLNEISKRGPGNLLNVRGEYSSGKSTFLGLLYIFLLYKYGKGEFKCIPAYFDLENNDVLQKIENGESYHNAAKYSFEKFTETIQVIANKEQQPVCYIIDGLDEQDCWSFSSEDSAGRGILDILSKIPGARYIMSFSQHRLPWFKDTLPVRKFSDRSDVMYFNPIDVQERGSKDARFASYVQAFKTTKMLSGDYTFSREHIDEYRMHEKDAAYEPRECEIIRKFRRLTISPGFLVHNFEYIFGQNQRCDVNQNYKYYIDKQNDECMEQIGYGFVHYATSMAYLFAYKGYTFEKFMHMSNDSIIGRKINEHHDKIYKTFLLIKKQQDVREYLIALHYNRELQYYAENPGEEIEKDSILNELITRNIAILIRLLWSDHNKFVIVCNKLLNRSDLNSCTLSMLVYILSNMDIMYPPIRDRLQKALLQKAEEVLIKQDDEKQTRAKERGESVSICNMENISEDDNPWRIIGNNMERLTQFVNLSLRHTILIYKFVDKSNTIGLAEELIKNKLLLQYNRQFQMLYYGDLTIRGEERKRALDPGKDIIGKGFDFHNTFMYLYFKLKSGENYFLKEFDMVTLCDLINSRLEKDKVGRSRITTFFFKESFSDKAKNILLMARELIASFLKGKKLADRNPFETYIATTKRTIDRRLKEMTALTEKSN